MRPRRPYNSGNSGGLGRCGDGSRIAAGACRVTGSHDRDFSRTRRRRVGVGVGVTNV